MIGRIFFDDPAPPAAGYRFAAMAALAEAFGMASQTGIRATVPDLPRPGDDVHDLQHVTADGRTAPNGLIWLERAGIRVAFCSNAERASLTIGAGDTLQAQVIWHEDSAFSIAFDVKEGARAEFRLDEYGRPWLYEESRLSGVLERRPNCRNRFSDRRASKNRDEQQRRDSEQDSDAPGTARQGEPLHSPARAKIAVLADPRRMRLGYPAVLAALGDAADARDCSLSIDIIPAPRDPIAHDLSARVFTDSDETRRWRSYDGVVLPGGADMERTEALVAAAAACRAADIPTLGLCLGMQAMCLAAARRTSRLRDATLAELDPDAALPLFTALRDPGGTPKRRLGDRKITVAPSSHLARRLQKLGVTASWRERMNHSYRLDPALLRPFAETGLSVLSLDAPDDVADVIEDPLCAFYVGSEGHPELSSRPAAPHPLMTAFLDVALSSTGKGSSGRTSRFPNKP